MLQRENLQQTIRLVLLGAFGREEPEITALVRGLSVSCPSLFEVILPRSEQELLVEDVDDMIDIVEDAAHKRPKAIGCLQPSYVRDTLQLPTRCSINMPMDFRIALRRAYEQDYTMPNIIHFGTAAIHWCKKISFFDPVTEYHCVFAIGDFVVLKSDDIVRIDNLLVHTLDNRRRVFLKISEVEGNEDNAVSRDRVLDLPMLRLQQEGPGVNGVNLIGLPALQSRKLYVIPVAKGLDGSLQRQGNKNSGDLLLVTWTLQYL